MRTEPILGHGGRAQDTRSEDSGAGMPPLGGHRSKWLDLRAGGTSEGVGVGLPLPWWGRQTAEALPWARFSIDLWPPGGVTNFTSGISCDHRRGVTEFTSGISCDHIVGGGWQGEGGRLPSPQEQMAGRGDKARPPLVGIIRQPTGLVNAGMSKKKCRREWARAPPSPNIYASCLPSFV